MTDSYKPNIVAAVSQPNARFRQWLFNQTVQFLSSSQLRRSGIVRWPPQEFVDSSTTNEVGVFTNLISVHIRWGDKVVDSDLHSVARYSACTCFSSAFSFLLRVIDCCPRPLWLFVVLV